MNLNDILSDPKLLIENKELVLDLYNQLKNDKTEQNYKMMLGIHQKNSERLIQTSEFIIDMSLIHISDPTRHASISYAVF